MNERVHVVYMLSLEGRGVVFRIESTDYPGRVIVKFLRLEFANLWIIHFVSVDLYTLIADYC